MRKRATLSWAPQTGWYVNLPHYAMIPDSFQPLIKDTIHANGVYPNVVPMDALVHNPTVLIDIPDDHVDPDTGQVDTERLRKIYAGTVKWDAPHFDAPELTTDDT
jgi:hypothetical protein